ncbi:MAG: DUF559 domain-containing protein [Caulobacter sp.]|nr:DUF559 domain-containing protein [Caulobacter sp.]
MAGGELTAGGGGGGAPDLDAVRDLWLREEGYRVLRFRNEDIALRTDWVIDEIRRAVGGRALPKGVLE